MWRSHFKCVFGLQDHNFDWIEVGVSIWACLMMWCLFSEGLFSYSLSVMISRDGEDKVIVPLRYCAPTLYLEEMVMLRLVYPGCALLFSVQWIRHFWSEMVVKLWEQSLVSCLCWYLWVPNLLSVLGCRSVHPHQQFLWWGRGEKIVLKQFLSRSAKSRLHFAVSGVKFMAPFWESAIRGLETFIFLCFAVSDGAVLCRLLGMINAVLKLLW